MKKLLLFFTALALFLFFCNPASAIYVTSGDLTLLTGLSWDHDEVKPEGSDVTGAPGFGTSSFYSNVTGSAIGGGVDYTSLRIYADYFTTPNITVGDITNFSYWSMNTNSTLIDWQVKIYTETDSTDSYWYTHRLNFNRQTGIQDVWTLSDIDTLGIADVYDKTTGGYVSGSHTRNMYDSETILFIDIIAGYATNSPSVYSYLDGVQIELVNDSITLDLGTPIPEPATMFLLGSGLIGFAAASRKKFFKS